jgi:hypothetical protein
MDFDADCELPLLQSRVGFVLFGSVVGGFCFGFLALGFIFEVLSQRDGVWAGVGSGC